MATAIEELYEADFFAWTQDQALRLRELKAAQSNIPLDLDHLAEEVQDLGLRDLREVRSQVRRIIEHCLKLEHSHAIEPRRGWCGSILDARAEIADALTRTLRRDLEAGFDSLYPPARKKAALGLSMHGESDAARSLPEGCPYSLEDVLREDWYPANRQGITDQA